MTLAGELETLRNIVRMRLGDPNERIIAFRTIDKIQKRFREIEDALR